MCSTETKKRTRIIALNTLYFGKTKGKNMKKLHCEALFDKFVCQLLLINLLVGLRNCFVQLRGLSIIGIARCRCLEVSVCG